MRGEEGTYFFDFMKDRCGDKEKTFRGYCALQRQIILDSFYDVEPMDFSHYVFPLLPILREKKEMLVEASFHRLATERDIIKGVNADHAGYVEDIINNLRAAREELKTLTQLMREPVAPNTTHVELARSGAKKYLDEAKKARITLLTLQCKEQTFESSSEEKCLRKLNAIEHLFILLSDGFSISDYRHVIEIIQSYR
jgi:hypothetical protein